MKLNKALAAAAMLLGLSTPAHALRLDEHDAAKLALYRANNEKTVILVVAATRGASAQVAALTKRLGGRVDFLHAASDYLTVVLPQAQVEPFLAQANVEAVDVDNLPGPYLGQLYGWQYPELGPEKPEQKRTPVPPVARAEKNWPPEPGAHNLDKAHSILEDLDGVAFRKRSPANDGRGVVVAHVEWFPDFLLPELQVAYDAQGKRIPKFADIINIPGTSASLDPDPPRAGEMWTTRLGAPSDPTDGLLEFQGRRYRVPAGGTYRMAEYVIRRSDTWALYVYPLLLKTMSAEARQKVRDGTIVYPVLWSDEKRMAWLDTDLDGDFTDEEGVPDYRSAQRFGVLGIDDPATPSRETIGYSIQKDDDYLAVNMGFGGHASMVAGAAVANASAGGRVEGVAPGAQVIAVSASSSNGTAEYVRALVQVFEDPRVDVVLLEGNLYATGAVRRLKDGRGALSMVADRLVALHPKPTFMTAFNSPGMSTMIDTTVPDSIISVGAYQSAQSVYSNHGILTRYADDLHWVGAEGPTGIGSLKPDFLSPANPISLEPRLRAGRGSRSDGVFEFPPGYGICSGTSCATPVAAGAAALLVGAAKREGLPHDAAAVHRAFRDGSRFIERLPAYKQGRGVIQLDAAWRALQATAPDAVVDRIDVAAPVRTATSRYLRVPDVGVGIFEREGWQAGAQAKRTVTLTRKSGAATPVAYRTSWQGDHSAFKAPGRILLPLDKPVELPIGISVAEAGVYSASLRLEPENGGGIAATVPVTIVVPQRFTDGNGYSVVESFDLERPDRRNLFFEVPEGAEVFGFSLQASRQEIRVDVIAPDNTFAGYLLPKDPARAAAFDKPMAGTWQLVVTDNADSRGFDWSAPKGEVLPATPVKLTASLRGVSVAIDGQRVALTNEMAETETGVAKSSLAGIRTMVHTLAAGQTLTHEIEVEAGTELLVAELEIVKSRNQDVALYLYDCSKTGCTTARRLDWNGRTKRILVENPNPGKWKVQLEALGPGEAEVRYSDYYAHPGLGSLTTTDSVGKRNAGAHWAVDWNAWRVREPRQGYRAAGLIRLQERDGQIRHYIHETVQRIHSVPLAIEPFLLD